MSILICGLNHKSAPLAVRERLAVAPEKHSDYLMQAIQFDAIDEVAIVSTCNRTELVCATTQSKSVLNWLSNSHWRQDIDLEPYTYVHHNRAAVRHLMRVACGLDSMVLGEPQILGQVKQAYHQACQAGTIGTCLGGVFRAVFAATKKVRSQTAIGANPVSIASAATNLAKQVCSQLHDKTVLLIGAGDTIELAARYLHQLGAVDYIVANRSVSSAQRLGERYKAKVIGLADIAKNLPSADIVISATSAPVPIIDAQMLASSMRLRQFSPVLLIDLAIPRDIDAAADQVPGVKLVNIDDLSKIIENSLDERQGAATEAQQIIELELAKYLRWKNYLVAVQAIKAYRSDLQYAAEEEVDIALKALAVSEPGQVVRTLARRLINKAMHQPTTRLRQAGVDGRHDMLKLAKYLLSE
jgi:glutamyl-tRNA reductase